MIRRVALSIVLLIFVAALFPSCNKVYGQSLKPEEVNLTLNEAEFHQEVEKFRQIFKTQIYSATVQVASEDLSSSVLVESELHLSATGCQVVSLTDEEGVPEGSRNIIAVTGDDAALGVSYYQSGAEGAAMLTALQKYGYNPLNTKTYFQGAFRSDQPATISFSQIDQSGNPINPVFKELRGTGEWEVFIGSLDPNYPNIVVSVSYNAGIVDFDAIGVFACSYTEEFIPSLGVNSYRPMPQCGDGWIGRPRYGQTNTEVEWEMSLVPGSVRTLNDGADVCWQKVQTKAYDPDTGLVIDFLGHDRDEYRGMAVGTAVVTTMEAPFWSSGIIATIGEVAPLGTRVIAGVSGWGAALGAVMIVWSGWDAYVESTDPRFERPALIKEYPGGRVFTEQRFIDDRTLFLGGLKYYIYPIYHVIVGSDYLAWVDPKQIVAYYATNAEGEPLSGFVMSLQHDPSRALLSEEYSYQVLRYVAQIAGEIEEQVGEDYGTHPAGPLSAEEGKLIADELAELMDQEETRELYPIREGSCLDPVDEQDAMDFLRIGYFDWPHSVTLEVIQAIQGDHMHANYSDLYYERRHGSVAAVHFPTATFVNGKRYHMIFACLTTNGYNGWYLTDDIQLEYDSSLFPYEYEQTVP